MPVVDRSVSKPRTITTPCKAPSFYYRGGKARIRRQIVRFAKLSGRVYAEPYAGRANLFFLMKAISSFERWLLNDLQTVDFLEAVGNYDGHKLPYISGRDIGGKSGYGRFAYKKYPNQTDILLMEPLLFWTGGRRGLSTPCGKARSAKTIDSYRRRLLAAKDMLKGVPIHQQDAVEFMLPLLEDPNNFLYLDPPYSNSSVTIYNGNVKERMRMIEALQSAKCSWLLSEYRCHDLDDAFGPPKAEIYTDKDTGILRRGRDRVESVECLYSNYELSPAIIDFGDSPAVIGFAKNLFQRNGGPLNYKQWTKICPYFWKDSTKLDQFKRLCRQPWTYFDGKTLHLTLKNT